MLGMLIRHNTPVGRHYIQQIWAAAVKSVMNLSAGSVSATQRRVLPSAALGCHCAPPRVTVSALSTMTAAVITSIGEEKKQRGGKKREKASAFRECHIGWVCVGSRLCVGFSDSRVDVRWI